VCQCVLVTVRDALQTALVSATLATPTIYLTARTTTVRVSYSFVCLSTNYAQLVVCVAAIGFRIHFLSFSYQPHEYVR